MGPIILGNIQELGPRQDAAPASSLAPRAGWPAKGTLDYLKTGIELLLLLLAIPWLARELFKHPGKVTKQAAAHHLKGG